MILLDNKQIKQIVSYYCKKFNTRNPFEIADYLGILYQIGDIGCSGCYMFLKNHRYISQSEFIRTRSKNGNGPRTWARRHASKRKLLFYPQQDAFT